MPEDASLDQFTTPATTDSEEEDDPDDAGAVPEDDGLETEDDGPKTEGDGADSEDAVVGTESAAAETGDAADSESADGSLADASSVEPAVSTYRWSPEGGECADCGGSAEKLWRGEGQKAGGLVCADCKEW